MPVIFACNIVSLPPGDMPRSIILDCTNFVFILDVTDKRQLLHTFLFFFNISSSILLALLKDAFYSDSISKHHLINRCLGNNNQCVTIN